MKKFKPLQGFYEECFTINEFDLADFDALFLKHAELIGDGYTLSSVYFNHDVDSWDTYVDITYRKPYTKEDQDKYEKQQIVKYNKDLEKAKLKEQKELETVKELYLKLKEQFEPDGVVSDKP